MLPTEETYHERKTPPIPSRFKIREQTSETFTHLPSQHNLDSSLERPQSTPSKPRFLLKPSQDAEKALMR